MSQPRIHATRADRDRAYRERQKSRLAEVVDETVKYDVPVEFVPIQRNAKGEPEAWVIRRVHNAA